MSRATFANVLTILCWVPLGIAFGLCWQACLGAFSETAYASVAIVVGYVLLLAFAVGVRHVIFSAVQRFGPFGPELPRVLYYRAVAYLSPERLIGYLPELLRHLPVRRWSPIVRDLLTRLGPTGALEPKLHPAWRKSLQAVYLDLGEMILPETDPDGPGPLWEVLCQAKLAIGVAGGGLTLTSKTARDRAVEVELRTPIPDPEIVRLENMALAGNVSALELISSPM